MDEALKEKLELETTTAEPVIQAGRTTTPEVVKKEAPVGKFTDNLKKWLVIHPKVKTGALVAAGIAFVAFDNAYNGGESYRQAAHEAGGGVLVVIGAYLGKNKLPS